MLYLIVGAGSEVLRVACISVALLSGVVREFRHWVWLVELFAVSNRRQLILVCDTHGNNHAFTSTRYVHIDRVVSCTFPKLAGRPQLDEQQANLPSNTQVARRRKRNRRALDVG